MAVPLILAAVAVALCVFWIARAGRRRQSRLPATAGVSTVGDDFEEFVKQRQTVLLSRSVDLGYGVGFELGIVGESHYMTELQKLALHRKADEEEADFFATLIPEPSNPYDPNAVAVLDDRGVKIGHLSREDALRYGPVFRKISEQGGIATCRAKLFGGTPEKPNIGVWLDIEPPRTLLHRLKTAVLSARPRNTV